MSFVILLVSNNMGHLRPWHWTPKCKIEKLKNSPQLGNTSLCSNQTTVLEKDGILTKLILPNYSATLLALLGPLWDV
jgi:hypothetical protein